MIERRLKRWERIVRRVIPPYFCIMKTVFNGIMKNKWTKLAASFSSLFLSCLSLLFLSLPFGSPFYFRLLLYSIIRGGTHKRARGNRPFLFLPGKQKPQAFACGFLVFFYLLGTCYVTHPMIYPNILFMIIFVFSFIPANPLSFA